MSARLGFLHAAYELRRDPRLNPYDFKRLHALLSWFGDNLPVPEKFNRSSSKGAAQRKTKGLSWFKDDADVAISKSFEIVSLLKEYGYPIEILRTDRIGFVVFEDDLQAVAEPFSDTPT